jgi:FtsP/CotA-like multicopper oxidase with cupredoxin domain
MTVIANWPHVPRQAEVLEQIRQVRDVSRFAVRPGERIRLRLINAANARIYGLRFGGHKPV